MAYVTQTQRAEANRTDLAEWLLSHHPADVVRNGVSVLLLNDKHVSVRFGIPGWRNWRTDDKGNNIDYLIKFLGYDYPSAVIALSKDFDCPTLPGYGYDTASVNKEENYTSENITLPKPAKTSRNVFAYLTKIRKIPDFIVRDLFNNKLLYQSESHCNAVFVNADRTYAEIRGTNSYADCRCRHRTECDDYVCIDRQWCRNMDTCPLYQKDSFHGMVAGCGARFWAYDPYPAGSLDAVYVCEAAIDAISLYAINVELGKCNHIIYTSIGGVANQKRIDQIKKTYACPIIIATDNDDAGNGARKRNPDLQTIVPVTHDWNDDLRGEVFYDTRT